MSEPELSELYLRWRSYLIYKILVNFRALTVADAEDAVQEAFIAAWQQLGQYDPDRSAPITWLANIAHWKAMSLMNAKNSKTCVVEETVVPSPHGCIEARQLLDKLLVRLDRLYAKDASAILERYLEGDTMAEIGEALDMTPKQAQSRLWYVRKLYRDEVDPG